MSKQFKTMDGNEAAAYVSYAFTEVAAVYPITPSTTMSEAHDAWAAAGMKNLFGTTANVVEMQSEAGAAGAWHGSLQGGALTTTFTASQGLLLKIPNMYKVAGELLPGVIHVSARAIATSSLSIFGDHQDVMAARQTGHAMLATNSVQEIMDLGGVAHLAAIKSRVPFLHFFDGFRTSHELQKVEVLDYSVFDRLLDKKAVQEFRDRALNPEHPVTRGTAQNDDIYFQTREVANKFYDAVPDIVNHYMEEISKETGRHYAPFNYYGAADAEDIIFAMGSVCQTARETIDFLNANGRNVGMVEVHLYRPFSTKYLFNVVPKTVKRVAVLDRTKENGSLGEPLYLDIVAAFAVSDLSPKIIGGRYGLASKDTLPEHILAVYKNLESELKHPFTIGINDDVTNLSLASDEKIITIPQGVTECLFVGLGSDGTVGANKSSIKIIGDKTDLYSQAYFAYDSKKSGGVTRSHLRFGSEPILSTYLVSNPHFISCSRDAYLSKYDIVDSLRDNGTFLLNTIWTEEETLEKLPLSVKKTLAQKNINMYIINAVKLAREIGLGNRTNTIMQSAFFYLNPQILPFETAQDYMKEYAYKSYGKKGDEIVNMNYRAIDSGASGLIKININPEWANETAVLDNSRTTDVPDFVKNIVDPVNYIKGDDLAVSAFLNYEDGTFESGTTRYEKRGIADFVPEWVDENCIQCNQCAYVCPHGVIRPVLLSENEMSASPYDMVTKKAVGKGLEELKYRIQVSPLDCTGCEVCVNACPGMKGNKALAMVPLASEVDKNEVEKAEYCFDIVTDKSSITGTATVKNSQFAQPLFEFSGACAGCGETPYIKLITQLYGDSMIIANATGCSSIYGGSAPVSPYTTNEDGFGPAWANSLFEDNAEFGFGIALGSEATRNRIQALMETNMDKAPENLKSLFAEWIENRDSTEVTKTLRKPIIEALESVNDVYAKEILAVKDNLVKKSIWIFGGDGWAYDIGYGGLDHVIANNLDVNILVMDTEVYSNTGGQSSKSSPTGSIAKFTSAGNSGKKKDLAAIAMTYGHVYVAQCSMSANQNQFLKSVKEAESHQGPSIILAYSPCIAHGIKGGMGKTQDRTKQATECGYWPIFRYDPSLYNEGKNPLILDCKEPNWDLYRDFLMSESRYAALAIVNPAHMEDLLELNKSEAKRRWQYYVNLAKMEY